MAERRMFSKRIMRSARFLKMPSDTRDLYTQLCLDADDDGVVEAYPVMSLLGCGDDNLKILATKGFVAILNEDLVSFITDWTEHNLIRADRKIDSIYKDLLLQIVPEAQLIQSRERADVKKYHKQKLIGRPMDSVGKDSVVEYSKDDINDMPSDAVLTQEQKAHLASMCFDKFYSQYPKKKGIGKAKESYLKCFKSLKTKGEIIETARSILNGLKKANAEWQSKSTEKQFIPYPTTWLNGKRWLDEYEGGEQASKVFNATTSRWE